MEKLSFDCLSKLVLPKWWYTWSNENIVFLWWELIHFCAGGSWLLDEYCPSVPVSILIDLGDRGDSLGWVKTAAEYDIIEIISSSCCIMYNFPGICSFVCEYNTRVSLFFVILNSIDRESVIFFSAKNFCEYNDNFSWIIIHHKHLDTLLWIIIFLGQRMSCMSIPGCYICLLNKVCVVIPLVSVRLGGPWFSRKVIPFSQVWISPWNVSGINHHQDMPL